MKIDRQFLAAAVAELVFDLEGRARLDRRHAALEIVHVEFEELALPNFRLLDTGIVARKVGHDSHNEWELDPPLGIVGIFVGDVDAGRAVAANEPLSAVGCHGSSPICIRSRTGLVGWDRQKVLSSDREILSKINFAAASMCSRVTLGQRLP